MNSKRGSRLMSLFLKAGANAVHRNTIAKASFAVALLLVCLPLLGNSFAWADEIPDGYTSATIDAALLGADEDLTPQIGDAAALDSFDAASSQGNDEAGHSGDSATLESAAEAQDISLSGTSYDATVDVVGIALYSEAYKVLDLVNQQRAANGLPALAMDQDLLDAAMQRAAETMVRFSHTRPNGQPWITASPKICGENIAVGQADAAGAMNSWMNSDGHRANILGKNFTTIGIGAVYQQGSIRWVQVFGNGTAAAATQDEDAPKIFQITLSDSSWHPEFRMAQYVDTDQYVVVITNTGWTSCAVFNSCVKWISDNESAATVDDDGIVTTTGSGYATITANFDRKTQFYSVALRVGDVSQMLTRLAGSDCYGTNLETIRQDVAENGLPKGIIVCNTGHFVDSLSAAALSGLLNYPILLVDGTKDSITNSNTLAALNLLTRNGSNKLDIVILGGKFAISDGIKAELDRIETDGVSERIFGDDGYDTNLAVYEYGKTKNGGWNTDEVLVATGSSYYDALGAGSYAAATKTFILLACPWKDNAKMIETATGHSKATILGGAAAISQSLESSLASAGVDIERFAGDDAYKTNVAFVEYAMEQGLSLDGCGWSTGTSYYDSLGSSHVLGASKSVMFLVNPVEYLNDDALDLINVNMIKISGCKIFGGTAAVTQQTEDRIVSYLSWVRW